MLGAVDRDGQFFAVVDAGPIAMLFAALYPERVTALVLLNVTARYLEAEDYPIGASSDVVDGLVETVGVVWGTPDFVGFLGGCR